MKEKWFHLQMEQIEKYNERFKDPEFYSSEEVKDAIFIEVYDQDEEKKWRNKR